MRAFEGPEGKEIVAFANAAERRFGDVLKVRPDELEARVTATEVQKLKEARKLMIAAQRFAREPGLSLERAQRRTRHLSR